MSSKLAVMGADFIILIRRVENARSQDSDTARQ
jgi:hypothetical protein